MTTLTDRDALVVLLIGSSNSAGNGVATSGALTRTLPATAGPRTFIWDRWLSANPADRTNFNLSNDNYGFAPLPSDASLLQNVPTPAFALAEQYENRFTGSDKGVVVGPRGTYKGAPGKICFIQYSVSSMRATLDAHGINPPVSFYPKAPNTATNTGYEVFTKLYLTPALEALRADENVDRIFIDGLYQIGHESAGYSASTPYATDQTLAQLESGMSMLHSEIARLLKIPSYRLPEITVKPTDQFAAFDLAANDTSNVPQVRDVFDAYASNSRHPLAVVDGNIADVDYNYLAPADPVGVANDRQKNHYTGQGALQLGEAMYQARAELGVGPVPVYASSWDGPEDITP